MGAHLVEAAMEFRGDQRQLDRRFHTDRRSGADTRPIEQRAQQGERRYKVDRRLVTAGGRPAYADDQQGWRSAFYCAATLGVLCILDVQYFHGVHSTQIAETWGHGVTHAMDGMASGLFGKPY
jgi:hypothetical protein